MYALSFKVPVIIKIICNTFNDTEFFFMHWITGYLDLMLGGLFFGFSAKFTKNAGEGHFMAQKT